MRRKRFTFSELNLSSFTSISLCFALVVHPACRSRNASSTSSIDQANLGAARDKIFAQLDPSVQQNIQTMDSYLSSQVGSGYVKFKNVSTQEEVSKDIAQSNPNETFIVLLDNSKNEIVYLLTNTEINQDSSTGIFSMSLTLLAFNPGDLNHPEISSLESFTNGNGSSDVQNQKEKFTAFAQNFQSQVETRFAFNMPGTDMGIASGVFSLVISGLALAVSYKNIFLGFTALFIGLIMVDYISGLFAVPTQGVITSPK